ncbi:MAG: hypothetical protein HRT56_05940 [Coraliomargarita sp.]|nr:hypothetical protein [Coraliomargarita sp.]
MQKDSLIGWDGFWSQPGGSDGGGSRTRAAANNAAAAKIRPVTRDEAATGVRGVARTVTHLGALLGWRLALLQILRSPGCLYFLEML